MYTADAPFMRRLNPVQFERIWTYDEQPVAIGVEPVVQDQRRLAKSLFEPVSVLIPARLSSRLGRCRLYRPRSVPVHLMFQMPLDLHVL